MKVRVQLPVRTGVFRRRESGPPAGRSFTGIAMQKRHVVVAMLLSSALVLAAGAPASATEVGTSRNLGLGVAVGTQTSLVGKYHIDRESALDFGLSFWRYRHGCWRDNRGVVYCDRYRYGYGPRDGGLGLQAGYLWQDNLIRRQANLDWHIGLGGRVWFWDNSYYDDAYYDDHNVAFAVRMPVGLDLTFNKPSFLEVYLEVAPALYVFPAVDLLAEAFIGVRFYF
jgi:hypothetical protein